MIEWDENRAREAVEAFHTAALQPELWPRALEKLAVCFDADGCMLLGGPTSFFEPICSPSLNRILQDAVRGMGLGRVDKDARVNRSLLAFSDGYDIVTESTILSAREPDRPPLTAEFLNRVNGRRFAGTLLAGEGRSGIVLELQRRAGREPFSEPERQALRRLTPHLQEAGNLALRLAQAHHEGLVGAFTAFDCGAVLLDWKGRVLLANTKAEVLMGETLTVRNGFLRASAGESEASLQKLIRAAIARGIVRAVEPQGAIAMARPGASPLLVHSAGLPRSAPDRFRQAVAALMIVDPDAFRTPQVPALRQIFGLTNSEAAVAVELARGRDIDEVAAMRRVSTGTVRAQLSTIFAKTGTRRQSELVALVLRYSRPPKQGLG
ncbi:MAG: helix-turn-helix transcriptional regulator [Methylocella sp.]